MSTILEVFLGLSLILLMAVLAVNLYKLTKDWLTPSSSRVSVAEYMEQLGQEYAHTNVAKCQQLLKEAQQVHPNNPSLERIRALTTQLAGGPGSGPLREARIILEHVLEVVPDYVPAIISLAGWHCLAKDETQARYYLGLATEEMRASADALRKTTTGLPSNKGEHRFMELGNQIGEIVSRSLVAAVEGEDEEDEGPEQTEQPAVVGGIGDDGQLPPAPRKAE